MRLGLAQQPAFRQSFLAIAHNKRALARHLDKGGKCREFIARFRHVPFP
jgi:hypothetical protein